MIKVDRKTYPWLPKDDLEARAVMAIITGERPTGDLVEIALGTKEFKALDQERIARAERENREARQSLAGT
jgi:hypothetical protein